MFSYETKDSKRNLECEIDEIKNRISKIEGYLDGLAAVVREKEKELKGSYERNI